MNRISLYEAIRRKKESQGLTAPKPAPVSDPSQRAEPRAQLKQPPVQEKPVISAKPAVKSPVIRSLSQSGLVKKRQKTPWLKLNGILAFFKKNPTTTWVGIIGVIVVMVLLGFFYLSGTRPNSDQPANPAGAMDTNKQVPGKIVEEKPVAAKQEEKSAPAQQPIVPVKQAESSKAQIPAAVRNQLQKQAESVQSQTPKPAVKGDHIIVIATYTKPDDLTPVAAYFRQNGIETDVLKQGSYYQLVTKERFENPERSGTDGYRMKQNIKRIGANYKAPSGYERFSSTPFQDAYGKKVK
jgi:hypothetical protein